MSLLWGASLLVAGAASAATFLAVQITTAPAWHDQATLAVDDRGFLHVAFLDGQRVAYGTNSSGAWMFEDIPGAADTEWSPSLAVGPAGIPHLAFERQAGSARQLIHASKLPSGWDVEVAAVSTSTASDPSLALDGQDRPYVLYTNSTGLYYLRKRAGAWIQLQVTGDSTLTGPSLAIDPTGRVHIAWTAVRPGGGVDREVWYLSTNADALRDSILEQVTTGGLDETDLALAVNGHGQAHIAYTGNDVSDTDVRYATNVSGAWQSYPVAESGHAESRPDIALTGDGSPRIVFQQGTDLVYAEPGLYGWAWTVVTALVDEPALSGRDHVAAVDGWGRVHVVSDGPGGGSGLHHLFVATSHSSIGEGPGTCWVPRLLDCGAVASGDTTGHLSHVEFFSCGPTRHEWGPEIAYAFTLSAGSKWNVEATLAGLSADLDVAITRFPGCAIDQCATGSSLGDVTASAIGLDPGTYGVVVDGFLGAMGPFELHLSCTRLSILADGFEDGSTSVWTDWAPWTP